MNKCLSKHQWHDTYTHNHKCQQHNPRPCHSTHLVAVRLDQLLVNVLSRGKGVHVLFEIHVEELKHQEQLALFHQHILQPAGV